MRGLQQLAVQPAAPRRRMTTTAPPTTTKRRRRDLVVSPPSELADAVFSQPLIKPVPRPQPTAHWWSVRTATPTEHDDATDADFSLTKKHLVVKKWTVQQTVDLVTSIYTQAIEELRAHYKRPSDWHPPSFPVIPPVFATWRDAEPSTVAEKEAEEARPTVRGDGVKKRKQKFQVTQEYNTRKAELVAYARELRKAMDLEPRFQQLGMQYQFGRWAKKSGLAESTGRSADALKMYFDIMTDPRTNIKPPAETRCNRLHAVDAEGNPVNQRKTKNKVGPSVKPSFRSIMRYVFFHKLPKGEGTWIDACRQMEELAWNADEIRRVKESLPEHTRALELLESDAKLETANARRRAMGKPLSDPPVGHTLFQQLALQTTQPPEEAQTILNSPGSTGHPDSITKPLSYPLSLAPLPPSAYKIPMVKAQGRCQGFTHERSVRAVLANYPEFSVQKKARVTVIPKLITTTTGETRTARNVISRATAVYGLNLEVLEQQLREEREWSEYISHEEEREGEQARLRRARYHTIVGSGRTQISHRMKAILAKREQREVTPQPTTAAVVE
jgi:hypothetical protein